MSLTVLQSTAQMQRKTRRPTHPFQVRHLPFQIQPFMLAPVLPGETLEFGNLQSRCVVDPIKSPFVGWWLEHYVFYVPHLSSPYRRPARLEGIAGPNQCHSRHDS